jgi:hypothetical protein
LTQTFQFFCIIRTVYGTTWLKIMIIPWLSQNIEILKNKVSPQKH